MIYKIIITDELDIQPKLDANNCTGLFSCDNNNNECIQPELICDGKIHCSNGKDEQDCSEGLS